MGVIHTLLSRIRRRRGARASRGRRDPRVSVMALRGPRVVAVEILARPDRTHGPNLRPMRKLTIFENTSLDGFFADAHSDMGWAHQNANDPEWQEFTAS